MPVKLPDGEIVSIQDERAKRLLRLKHPLRICCDSCQPVAVNGLLCHETGCPEAWKDAKAVCDECGQEYDPEERDSRFCSRQCKAAYHGESTDEHS